jgi:hypothetical protein
LRRRLIFLGGARPGITPYDPTQDREHEDANKPSGFNHQRFVAANDIDDSPKVTKEMITKTIIEKWLEASDINHLPKDYQRLP